ncbi:hypothetical protein NIES593_16420 [Hydrococcus rivularis NIES-593]|uniref:Uncharacterized protein n=1 Tax=Hydrococcus rivularis NIES-593 TaxID=1921803 RepID=A0A1U7HCD0_9CYAN|nr:CTB family bacteriocin [Hydrococcus rivularis]OKH21201.1 hypothetical protein NIES593_16420 [Hydrococcus rivularis NIES-593]
MLNRILETNLLSELSDKQQEIVAGGGQLSEIAKEVRTAFEASNTVFKNSAASTEKGSMVDTTIDNMFVNTSAFEDLTALFNGAGNGVDP